MRRILIRLALALLLFAVSACQGVTSSANKKAMITIGVVNYSAAISPVFDGFQEGLKALGYEEGKNVHFINPGPTGDIPKLSTVIQGFIDQKVDMIFSLTTPAAQAASKLTAGTNIPVIFASVFDPQLAGVIDQPLSHPGKNMTGIRHGVAEGKRFEWLTQVAPDARTFYVPYNTKDASAVLSVGEAKKGAAKLGITLILHPFDGSNPDEITAAIQGVPPEAQAIFMPADNTLAAPPQLRQRLIPLAVQRKLPLAVVVGSDVETGALMSYGFNYKAVGRQAARLADQVLKGVSPGDLPIEAAEFFLSLNLDTANKIGLAIPDEIVRRANFLYRITPPDVAALESATPAPTPKPTLPTF